jgi:hypothetical protein
MSVAHTTKEREGATVQENDISHGCSAQLVDPCGCWCLRQLIAAWDIGDRFVCGGAH